MGGIRIASVIYLLIGLSSLSKGQGNATVQACVSGQCDEQCGPATYQLGPPNTPTPPFLKNFTLPSDDSKTGGGIDVWFNISQPLAHCTTQITVPFSEDYSTTGTGNVVVDVSQAGCYYAHISSGKGFYPQYCCDDTCSRLGEQNFVKRHGNDLPDLPPQVEPTRSRTTKAPSSTVAPPSTVAASLSCSSPWSTMGALYQKAGNQTVISAVQDCSEEDDCQLSTSQSISVSSQLTSEKSTSLTNSVGASVAVTAGGKYHTVFGSRS